MKRSSLALVVALCLAFGLRALLLIDATALWSDELYSVGKSFQPSFGSLLEMLREDTHPPAYYGLLWLWGHWVGQSPISLRLLSWLAYLAGGLVMIRQSMALAQVGARTRVAATAALLAFCSPYPIRFAIEGKSYAVLVLLVALAWWWRRSAHPIAYGAVAGLAGLTRKRWDGPNGATTRPEPPASPARHSSCPRSRTESDRDCRRPGALRPPPPSPCNPSGQGPSPDGSSPGHRPDTPTRTASAG